MSRVVKYMSVYWGKKLNKYFKVVQIIGKMKGYGQILRVEG